MKKFLCVLLAAMLLLTCFAGCKSNPDDLSSISSVIDLDSTTTHETFKKPENYASVVTVSINPQFRLYLDVNGTVLAVEPVNDDAKSIETKVSFENKNVKEVVNNLIVAANDSGFVKTDVKIDIKVTEVVDETVVATEILEDIKTAATQKLKELEIKAEVITAVELQAEETVQSEKDLTSSEEQTVSKENTGNNTSSKEDTTTSKPQDEKPVCSHTNTDVKSISTGSNVIDSSKLDAVNHTKVCKDCGVQVSLEKHSVSNGKCTVCGQSNFAVTDLKIGNAGISGGSSGHCGVELNGDGTPDYDLMVQDGYDAISFDSAQQYLDEETWVYKIPEAVFLEALKTKYVVDDALFARIKAQGKYNFYWHEHSYSNGIFFMAYVAAGDEPDFTHETLGYKDNGNGTFTVYYDYLEGGPSLDKSELVHKYYYAVEYSYSGASNLSVVKKIENDYEYYCINGWTPVVNTLRIKSIKKVTDINGITTVK